MSIVHISHTISAELAKEIEALEMGRTDPNDPTKRDISLLMNEFPETICGFELNQHLKRYPSHLKIFDIGCGPGFSSLFMALQGHEVSSLDPSPFDCKVLEANAKKLNLQIPIYQCTAEAIDQISETGFDLCIFNSSLHHCDDPVKALKNCRQKLKNGGKILLVNEPILKFYRSKKWFANALIETPEKMGHYGGNEHIYYYSEYKEMLAQAEFTNTRDILNFRLFHPRIYIQNILPVKINGIHINSDFAVLVKFFCFLMMKNLLKYKSLSTPFVSIMKRLSLLQVTFESSKE